jgi:regulator of sigma E protease
MSTNDLVQRFYELFERVPYLGAALAVLGVLIFVHELGHFLIAKLFGVGALEFALGFGKPLFKIQGKETTYTLRAVPLGGFVRMAGDDPRLLTGEIETATEAGGASPIEGTQEQLTPAQTAMVADQSRWFLKKPYLVRCAIVLAGPVANFLFAWALGTGMFYVNGLPEPQGRPVVVGSITKGLPGAEAGLKPGDKVSTVDGKEVGSYKELVDVVRASQGKPLSLVVERPIYETQDGEPSRYDSNTITVTPKAGFTELDVVEGRGGEESAYRIGIAPPIVYVPCSLTDAFMAGGLQVVGIVKQTLHMFGALFRGALSPKDTVGGPLEIIKQTASSAQKGWMHLIMITILINIALGVMNLLPIPVLDGGHLLLFTIEKIKGSPLGLKAQMVATQVGMAFLLLLMVFAFGNDLRRIFFP